MMPTNARLALALDFGGPISLTPFELVTSVGSPLLKSLLQGRGPFASEGHPDVPWQELQSGLITERAYWHDVAARWNEAGGGSNLREMLAELSEPARPELLRPEALALARQAREAGIPVAILSNDLQAFHGEAWVEQMKVYDLVDVVIDGSIEGVLKPDPRLYKLAADRLGVGLSSMVFLDDQPTNIRGAEGIGVPSVWFDITDPSAGYASVRRLLGLPVP